MEWFELEFDFGFGFEVALDFRIFRCCLLANYDVLGKFEINGDEYIRKKQHRKTGYKING